LADLPLQLGTRGRITVVGAGAAMGGSPVVPVAVASTRFKMAPIELKDRETVIAARHPVEVRHLIACGAIGGTPDDRGNLFVGMREQNGSGCFGIAWLQHDEGNTVGTTVFVIPFPELDATARRAVYTNGQDVVIPNRLYHGRCNEILVHPLNPLAPLADLRMRYENDAPPAVKRRMVSSAIPVAVSTTKLNRSLRDILATECAIAAHRSYSDLEIVACGAIGGTTDEQGNLFCGLREENGSGYFGVAWLLGAGDVTTVMVLLGAFAQSGN